MKATKEDIKIYGRLVNATTEGVVADAEQIWDSNAGMSQTDYNIAMNEKFESFQKNPVFNDATFKGNVNFNDDVTIRGEFKTSGKAQFANQVDFDDVVKMHGIPTGLEVDHKITCNDLDVHGDMKIDGTFEANVVKSNYIDTNTLTVHEYIKNEGEFKNDGNASP